MSKINFNKLYKRLGLVLCATAGGIVGFITGGPFSAALGIIVGLLGAYILERNISIA